MNYSIREERVPRAADSGFASESPQVRAVAGSCDDDSGPQCRVADMSQAAAIIQRLLFHTRYC